MTGFVRVVTPPIAYPVTLDEAKEWCRIDEDDTSQDNTLRLLIAAAVAHAEDRLTGRAYVERTLELNLDYFPYCIELPYPPLLGIASISYTDANGDPATFVDYEADPVSEPGRVRCVYGSIWPSIGRGFNPVRIRYYAGYRPTGSPTDLTDNSYLPAQLRRWMSARICTLFENRDQMIVGASVQEIPRDFVDGELDPLVLGSRFF